MNSTRISLLQPTPLNSTSNATYWLPSALETKYMEDEFARMDHLTEEDYESSTAISYDGFNETDAYDDIISNGSIGGTQLSSRIGWTDITLASIFCCIIAGTLVGNTLVIAAVVTTRRLRTVTNCFVMSLAVADWLVGMFVMPPKVMLHFIDNMWPFGKVGCDLWISLDILLCTASILSLCCISIDRYLAITRPLAYSRKRRSKRLALSMISCVWVAAVVITSPPILGWYDNNPQTPNVSESSDTNATTSLPIPSTTQKSSSEKCEYSTNEGYVIYSALGSFFLPLFVMLYVYARIACVIARRQRTIQKLHNSSSSNEKKYFDSEDVGDDVVHHFPASTLNKHSSLNLSSSSLTFWGCLRLKKLPCKSNKHDTQSKRGSNLSDVIEPLQTQMPNSATILSMSRCNKATPKRSGGVCSRLLQMGSAKGSTTKGTGKSSLHKNGSSCTALATNTNGGLDEATCNALLLTSSANLTRLRTGSRLCHHSLANLSPQKSMVRRVQTSSASRVSASTGASSASSYTDNNTDVAANRRSHSRKSMTTASSNSNPRIWTIEDEPDLEGIAKHVNSALLSDEREVDDDQYGNHQGPLMYGSLKRHLAGSSPNSKGAKGASSGHAGSNNHINLNSYACPKSNSKNIPTSASTHTTALMSVTTGIGGSTGALPTSPSHPSKQARSKSVKLSLTFQQNDQNQNNSTSKEFTSGRIASFKRETKTAQTLAAVVGGFIICWLPFFVVYVLSPFVKNGTSSDALVEFFVWLGWGNSAINPFIYAFYSADFRSAFWRLTFHRCEGMVRAARSPDRNSPKRCDDPQAQLQLRTSCPP